MSTTNPRALARIKRKARIRKRLKGTTERPRLCVFRSARHIYAQVIDDRAGATIVTASSVESGFKEKPQFESKMAAATFVGQMVAQRALERGVKKVVFDRNGFLYHGRIKAVSDGAREAGLEF
ncbi:MAG: 50S ribosomal protein L18 [Desulfatitalea sp.]|nr:50S ribosomal protein L18 [Desulfatitalea sp.]NNK00222.1 50S ribosomal protein L18 [Desulfatitalea sp.]